VRADDGTPVMDVFMAPVMALDVSSFSAARRGGQFQQGHGNGGVTAIEH
jgi:hypothetical protein